MQSSEVGLQRLTNQRVHGTPFKTAVDVVGWLGAMQAQDYHGALWSLGLRMDGATITDVEQAIENAEILRTWPMRGTIHFVPPSDARWMLELCASKMLAKDARRLKQLELTVDDIWECEAHLRNALEGGNRLSRPDVMTVLEEAGISTEGQRGYHILWYLSQSGVLCIGPMEGKQQTFVLFEEWAPEQRMFSREDAIAELAGRFFASHGPATDRDFSRWTGLNLTDSRKGIKAKEETLIASDLNGMTYWQAKDSLLPAASSDEPHIDVLPGFDEFVLGYKNRDDVLDPAHAQKICPGKNGVFYPTVVVNGNIIATWKRRVKKKGVEISISPFGALGRLQTPIEQKFEDYARFLELPILKSIVEH